MGSSHRFASNYLTWFPACRNFHDELHRYAFCHLSACLQKQQSQSRPACLWATIVERRPAIFFSYSQLRLSENEAGMRTGWAVMGARVKHTLLGKDCSETRYPTILSDVVLAVGTKFSKAGSKRFMFIFIGIENSTAKEKTFDGAISRRTYLPSLRSRSSCTSFRKAGACSSGRTVSTDTLFMLNSDH